MMWLSGMVTVGGLLTLFNAPRVLSLPLRHPVLMCQLEPVPAPKRRGQPYFLASPLSDTVPAPRKTPPPRLFPSNSLQGHFGQPVDRPMYGQLFKVQKTGGADLPADVSDLDSVVIVPWDYDSACQPVPWAESYHWLREPGIRFFNVALRDRDSWYHGLPTFDAFAPENAAYPPALNIPVYGGQEPTITPDELFSFYDALPAEEDAGAPGALDKARQWSKAHAAFAQSNPLKWIIWEMLHNAARERAIAMTPPMVGTYRLTVKFPDGKQRIFYARTLEHPHAPYLGDARESDANKAQGPSWDHFGEGFELWFFVASSEDSLIKVWKIPRSVDEVRATGERSMWPWHISWALDSSSGKWPATIEPYQFFPMHPREPAMDTLFMHQSEWFDAHWNAHTLPRWFGWFTMGPGNAVRFEEPVPMGSAGTMLVKGERISVETVIDSLTTLRPE
jgi:hypothetical protein